MPDLFTDQKQEAARDRRFNDAAPAQEEQGAMPPSPIPMTQSTPIATPEQPKQTRLQAAGTKLQTKIKDKMANVHNMNLFDAFCENPAKVFFETQEPDEQVLLFLRKSQWVNFPWILATVGLSLVPIILFFFRGEFTTFTPPAAYLIILIPFYYIGVLTFAFVNFITWYYNAGLITNKRVIDVDFHQLVYKEIDETKLALVQDVSYQQVGIFQNILGFGHVLIQTAGTIDNFEFFQLPRPARVVEVVENLIGGKRFYEP